MTTPLAKQIAEAAYFAAAEFYSCVEILHAGNVEAVTTEIEKRNCGKAFELVKESDVRASYSEL